MNKLASGIFSVVLTASAFFLLLFSPAEAIEAARSGLEICAGLIVPTLLPFMIVSGLVAGLGIPALLARAADPLMRKLFGVGGVCCTPFIIGLTGGYPVGAASVAELVKSGEISPEEGSRLLPFCNNTGPAFIIGAAGTGIFASSARGILLYLSHILAALAVGLLFSRRSDEKAPPPPPSYQVKSLAAVLPAAVKNAVLTTLSICGFVVFFSVLTGLLDHLGIFSFLAGEMSRIFGLELRFCRSLLSGILELGNGIGSMRGLSASPANMALASFVLGFGSLSVHCQTLAVTEGTDIKCARHFAGRILHGALSALFTFVFSMLLQI